VLNTNPPWVMWSRGNPDTKIDGSVVNSAADATAYTKMGDTWSVPAIGNVDTTTLGNPEWRAYVGSGYGLAGEGTVFYELNAATGDVISTRDVGNGTTTWIPRNSLVASPSGYNSYQLDIPDAKTRGTDLMTRVYIPDVHGRIWKFTSASGGTFANLGPNQPFGNPVGLIKLRTQGVDKPYVFANAGNDRRVTPTGATPPFRMYGFRDDATTETDFATAGTLMFNEPYPDQFRAAGQPATAFNANAGGVKGRVFFTGTRINRTDASCLTTFDTILFALGAETGVAVYDFDGSSGADKSTLFLRDRLMGPQVSGGQLLLSESGKFNASGTQVPPSVNPPSGGTGMSHPPGSTVAKVSVDSQTPSSTICRY
jgi:hypothetical protein